jgi:cellulose biosynthesis protein BcsQ
MVGPTSPNKTEIISVASGKGGTGKTLILASLGYALKTSGQQVLFIDSDTATDGLSLFILGPRGWEAISEVESRNILSEYLRSYQEDVAHPSDISGFKVNRGRKDDHGQIYELLLSGRGLYGDLIDEIGQAAVPQLTREHFRSAISLLFDSIRASNQWDYVLVDTRGGFGFNTTDVCALSDSFFLVTEPDYTSFYQDKNLIYRISAAAAELSRKPVMRGVIVNKATEISTSDVEASLRVHELNLDKVEANFRNILVDEFSIRYSDTHPVPLDIEAVHAYKAQKIPYVSCPGSVFSYATMVAFSNLMKTITVRWSEEATSRWNALVDRVSDAIKGENERKLSLLHKQNTLEREREKLHQQNELLREQIEELKKTFERRDALASSAQERDLGRVAAQAIRERNRFGIAALVVGALILLSLIPATVFIYQNSRLSNTMALENEIKSRAAELALTRQQMESLMRQIEQLQQSSGRPPQQEAPPQRTPQK